MRPNRRQLATKTETTPGTAIAVAAADVLVRIRQDSAPSPEVDRIETEEVQATSSKRPPLIGTRRLPFNCSYLLRGPGSVSTAPAVKPLFEAGMLLQETVKKISIGAITGGPLKDGETITGGTSGGTGKVFRDTATGVTTLRYIPISGTLVSGETLTGGTSGATCSTSSTPSDDGKRYRLTDSSFSGGDSLHHVTGKYFLDGYAWTGRGCLGELSLDFKNGNPVVGRQAFQGGLEAVGDAALLVVPTYPEESIAAPRFNNAGLFLGSYAPTDLVEMTLQLPLGLFLREDANDDSADGILFADYNRGVPTITFEPAMVKAATFDYFTTLFNGTKFAMKWHAGTIAGSIWDFFADECQLHSGGASSREDLATIPIEIGLYGTDNNELFIWQH